MIHEQYGLWIMAVMQTRQDVIKFALLYIPIGEMSSYVEFKNLFNNISSIYALKSQNLIFLRNLGPADCNDFIQ